MFKISLANGGKAYWMSSFRKAVMLGASDKRRLDRSFQMIPGGRAARSDPTSITSVGVTIKSTGKSCSPNRWAGSSANT